MGEYSILVDSHVHFYNCYNIRKFFNCAINNFKQVHNRLELTKNFVGILFFTETGETNYFKRLYDNKDHYSNLLGLRIEYTSEYESLRFKLDLDNYLIIIAGQQIVTKENLEVLAVGTTERFNYGVDILSTINMIKEKNAVPVIPWGIGKWFGNRGRLVKDVIQNNYGFFLGDNSGRPVFWSIPDLYRKGIKKKVYTLRGSDPLPIKSQERKVGSFGFYFVSKFDVEKPCVLLKEYFKSLNKEPDNYGKLESVSNFIRNQFLMQVKKLTK